MKMNAILKKIDEICPFSYQESWDNSGLQLGSGEAEVSNILLAFDLTEKIVAEAIERDVDLILTHHPLFFRGIRSIRFDDGKGRMIAALIQNHINVVSCHTNLDKVGYGVSAVLGRQLGLQHCRPFLAEGENCGFGVIGTLSSPCPLGDFALEVKSALGLPCLRMVGEEEATVYTVAAMGGAGSDFLEEAKNQGADVYVTADLKYHDGQKAAEMGLAVIDAGHFQTEMAVIKPFGERLAKVMPEVEFILAEDMEDYWLVK